MNYADMLNADFWAKLVQEYGVRAAQSAARIVVILIMYQLVRMMLRRMIDGLVRPSTVEKAGAEVNEPRVLALRSVLKSVITFVLGFVAVIMVLQSVGINIVPLLTTASVAGLAVGFGAQKLVKDVICGFFMLMEDQLGLGDTVTVNTVKGTVEEVAMRITRIRAEDGALHTFANGDITSLSNHSRPRKTTE
jgi:moderate conductance mechanosensitive channel